MLNEAIVACYNYGYNVMGAATLFTNIPALFLICYKSPDAMRVYKGCLINLTICNIFNEIYVDLLLRPLFIFSLRSLVMQGPLKFFPFSFGAVFYALVAGTVGWTAYSLTVSFVYRYMSVADDRFSRYLQRGGGKNIAIGGAALFFAIVVCIYTVLDKDEKQMKLNLVQNEPYFAQYDVKDLMISGYPPNANIYAIIVSIVTIITMASTFIVWLISAWITINQLRRNRAKMTPATFRLQKQLTQTLIIQCACPLILGVIPLIMQQIYLATKWPSFMADSEMLTCFINHAVRILPCVDAILTIVLVGPYRNAVAKWTANGYKWLKMKAFGRSC